MAEPMVCPRCGVEMNFHAEKLVYSEPHPGVPPATGQDVEEIHTCPRCGMARTRMSRTL